MTDNRKTTHYFKTTEDAYTSTQIGEHVDTEEPVLNGDILIIESERVIGLCDTWPFALTQESGDLHRPASISSVVEYCANNGIPLHQLRHAQDLAADRNW